MIFSVSNNGIQWTVDFGLNSVTLNVIDLVQNETTSPKQFHFAALNLLFQHRQYFLDDHPAKALKALNQHGTMLMRDDGLSSSIAENETSGYQLSHL